MLGTKEEMDALDVWANTHDSKCPIKYGGAIGGKYTYSFTPTSLGTVCKIECACGAKHDATEYDKW